MAQVTVSDGFTGDVRRLRFLELEDSVDYRVDGPYTHTYDSLVGQQEVQYVLSDWPEPPPRPEISLEEAKPDTVEYALWQVYLLYQAVLKHEQKRAEQMRGYLADVSRYILKTCIDDEFREHVVTTGDFDAVKIAAACPEVSKEDLEAELASTFQGVLEWYANIRGIRTAPPFQWDELHQHQGVGNSTDVEAV